MAEEKLRQQLKDISALYDQEREKNRKIESSLTDLRRREPLVQMLWQETSLLRRLLDKQMQTNLAVVDLPTGRLRPGVSGVQLSDKDRLAVMALNIVQNENATAAFPPSYISGQLSGGSDPIALATANTGVRVAALQTIVEGSSGDVPAPAPDLFAAPVPAAGAAGVPPAPASLSGGGAPAAAAGGDVPPPPAGLFGGVPPAPAGLFGGVPPAPAGLFGGAPAGVPPPPAGLFGGVPAAPAGLFGGVPAAPSGLFGDVPTMPNLFAAPPVPAGPEPTKPLVKPGKKMKALHWKSIIVGAKDKRDDVVKKSLWAEIEDSYNSVLSKALNKAEFEELFTGVPVKKDLAAKAEKKADAEEEKGPKRLFETRRYDQLSIMLSKMPPMEVQRKALLELDAKALTMDQIDSLHKNIFTSEELAMVRDSGLPPARLQVPEQWVLGLGGIPQIAARLECWRFSLVFEESYTDVHRPLARVESACAQIGSSKAWKQLMGIILVLGNHLNGSTPRGQADGFQLESLSKLARVKDSSGEASLLDYIITVAIKMHGEGFPEQLGDELSLLQEVKNFSLKTIAAECRKLVGKANLNKKMQSLVSAAASAGASDPFEARMTAFNDKALARVESLEKKAGSVTKAFVDLVQYLEPDMARGKAEQVDTEEFFATVNDFVQYVINAAAEMKRRKEYAEREAKQAVHLAELKKALTRSKKGAEEEGAKAKEAAPAAAEAASASPAKGVKAAAAAAAKK